VPSASPKNKLIAAKAGNLDIIQPTTYLPDAGGKVVATQNACFAKGLPA